MSTVFGKSLVKRIVLFLFKKAQKINFNEDDFGLKVLFCHKQTLYVIS